MQILGFPVQLVGLLTLPYLIVRWTLDGQSAGKDIEGAVVSHWSPDRQQHKTMHHIMQHSLIHIVSLCGYITSYL